LPTPYSLLPVPYAIITIDNNGGVMNMSEVVFLVEEDPEGGYTARALGESIFTQADTLDELRTMVRDAVECHFEGSDKDVVVSLRSGKGNRI
ncbi:hypothetical protein, partial [Moorena sp. SIO4A5]